VTDTHTDTDGQIHDDGMSCISIASRGKNRPYCTRPTKYNYYAGNEHWLITKCTVIITYLNDNAQTPLNRLAVYMLYSQLCNTLLAAPLEPMERRPNINAVLVISNSRSAANCLSQLMARASAVQWRIFLSPQLPIQNGSREQNHAPFRGDLSSLWQDLI